MTTFEDSFSEEIWRVTYKDYKDQSVDDSLRRVATAVASVEETDEKRAEWTEKFYDMLSDFKVTTGGRIMANAGTEFKGTTLMNCYVLPGIEHDPDSLEGIIQKLRYQAITLKSEGGVGFNTSILRPRGSFIDGIGVETPGAVKFAELFDKSSEIITAGSGLESSNARAKKKIRKGAQMLIIDIWHPDIIEFITAKQTPGRLTKFNMSVNCTDNFMQKVIRIEEIKKQIETLDNLDENINLLKEEIEKIDKWDLIFPDTSFPQYKSEWDGNINKWLGYNRPIKVYKTVSVMWLWNLIMESTYNRAEPGVIFLDRANDLNPMWYNDRDYIDATNPCAEQFLPKAGVCNLASINLTQFVTEEQKFDFNKFKKFIPYAIRFLDNVNDLTGTPLPEYREYIDSRRRIGLGIMGWGSTLYMLNIRFASTQADNLKKELMRVFVEESIQASINLAKEKGMFPACEPLKHATGKYFKQIGLDDNLVNQIKKYGIRNSTLFSCQPNGNTSLMANVVSGGIEPVFISVYIRTVIVSSVPEYIQDVTPKWYEGHFYETEMFKLTKEGDEEILRGVAPDGVVYKIDKNRGLTKEVLCEDYGVRWLKKRNLWDVNADWNVNTIDLTTEDHINDLKGFAFYIDSSLSKTINLPYDYTYEDFKNIYLDGYKTGYIKGLTTYRMGTMTTVLSAKEEQHAEASDEEIILDDVKLPASSPAIVKKIKAEGKKWYLTVILDDEQKRPFALFVQTNAVEKNVTTVDAVDKLLELARNKGIPDRHIVDVEDKMAGEANAVKIARMISLLLRHGVLIKNIIRVLDTIDVTIGSFIFQIKKFLSQYIKDGEKVEGVKCENCGSNNVVYSEGCYKCNDCGSSKCGG
jgi:ribonucleoside-diphosphate reductase alpha chain